MCVIVEFPPRPTVRRPQTMRPIGAPPDCQSDPIFAAIEAINKADANHSVAVDQLAVAEERAWKDNASPEERRAYAEANERSNDAGSATLDALQDFVETIPTTKSGMLSAIAFVVESREDKNQEYFFNGEEGADLVIEFIQSIGAAVANGLDPA